jgi:FAD/FMN-containing dehydrogenase
MRRVMSPQVRRNWAGNEACVPDAFATPRSTAEVASLVREAHAQGGRVKVIGAGHSFTPIAMTKGILISMDAMNTVSEIDPETGQRPSSSRYPTQRSQHGPCRCWLSPAQSR